MKTIVWDVDDVLNDLMRCWFEQDWIVNHPGCKLKYEDLKQNPPHEILKISLKEYLNSLDNYRVSKKAFKMRPVKEIMDWFVQYGAKYRHIALTARSLETIPASSEWVFRHFGIWIRGFHFVPAKREGPDIVKYDQVKSGYLKWFGKADIFIDDSPGNVRNAEKLGIKTVLFPRPWNKSKLNISEALNFLK